ncbi:MAG: hypothetical protein Q8P18_03495 [Pseudomonadota bacterium]|nr:hypothetical protein [Pseudomonadota bacterium]
MRRLLPVAVYMALAVVLTWPAALHPVRDLPGADRTDLWDSLWSLWYFWVRVSAGELPYRVDGLLDHPTGGVLWVADPVNAVFALPLIPLVGVAATWTVLVLGHLTFAGIAAHRLGEAVSPDRPWAGWVTGVLYASAPLLMAHVHNGASEAVGTGWMAWAALRLVRLEAAPTPRNAGLAGLAVALTAVAHWYAGVGIFLLAGLMLLRARTRPRLVTLVGALALACALVLPVAWLARNAATTEDNVVGIKSDREIATVRRTIGPADPLGFVHPGDYRSPDFRELSRYGEQYIHCHYLGWVGLLAMLAALRRRRDTGVWWAGALLAAALACGPVLAQKGAPVILSGNLAIPLPYFLVEALPGFSSLSLLWRLAQLTVLAVAVLAGRAAGGSVGIAALVAVAALAETVWVSPMAGQRETTDAIMPAAIVALAAEPEGALMNFPVAGGRAFLYEQTVHHKPLTGGLNFPNNNASRKVWKEALLNVNAAPEALAEAVGNKARQGGVRYLVVHIDAMARPDMHDPAVRALKYAFTPIAEGDGVRVYRLW